MHALLRFSLGFLSIVGLVARAADTQVRVEASRGEFRLAIVDATRNKAQREAVHQAFVAGFEAAIAKTGAPLTVKAKAVNADHAAFNLGTGVYDAVLVIGTSLPRPLILSDTARLTATLGAGKEERKAFLVFRSSDEGLEKVLTAAFVPAVTGQRFLDALSGEPSQLAGGAGGSKVAAAQ